MPLPAIIPALASMLAWIGIDLGISWLSRGDGEVVYVSGLDFGTFIGSYWLAIVLYLLLIASAVYLAIPKHKNNGRGDRHQSLQQTS